MIGNEFFEIQYSVIRQLIDWNTNAPDNISTDIDKRFVQAILLILLPREQLAENNIPECVLDFVERESIQIFAVFPLIIFYDTA